MEFKKRKAEMASTEIETDEPIIIPLLQTLNSHPSYLTTTTNSCSGRVSITKKKKSESILISSHELVDPNSVVNLLFPDPIQQEEEEEDELVFRFEPFTLAVECKDTSSAQSLVSMAISCGFTESGITNVQKHVIIATIRGSIRLEVPLGSIGNILVSPDYVRFLVETANHKMELNRDTIDGFSQVLVDLWNQDCTGNEDEGNFESAELIVGGGADSGEATLGNDSSIPEELYQEILVRAPVKSLLVSKCVCKTWYQLISSPGFVKSHLNRTTASKHNNPGLMLVSGDHEEIYSISSYDSLLLLSQNEESCDIAAVEMDHPFKSVDSWVALLGSCNGLLLLRIFDYGEHGKGGFLCLWNPATREYKKIPDLKIPESANEDEYYSLGIYAFGYDYKIDNYKVFETLEVDYETRSFVNVYTLGLDSWKSIQTIPYSFPSGANKTAGVLVNGSLHWVGKTGDEDIIVSLNVSDDRFEEMKLPKEGLKEEHWFHNVEVLEGCLCVLNRVEWVGYEVWVMGDYGVQESWTKLYVITCERFWKESLFGIKCFFMNDEIFLEGNEGLILYNPRDSSVRVPKIGGLRRVSDVMKFVESLVSLNSGTFAGRQNLEEMMQA